MLLFNNLTLLKGSDFSLWVSGTTNGLVCHDERVVLQKININMLSQLGETMNTMWTNSHPASLSSLMGAKKDIETEKRTKLSKLKIDVLQPVRQRLDRWEIRDPKVAKFIYKTIPTQCPFERDIKLFGRKVGHIPPLCKLNPLYDQLVGLRFRALCYLVDECGVNI